MRKFTPILFSVLFVLAFAQTAFAGAGITAGVYKVGSTSGADFTLLSQAIDAINAATITGDVVLEITSDITEPTNFGLAKNLGGYKLTIRPDADADRTITFTQTAGNVGPYGHFVIGCATGNLGSALSDGTVVATDSVTIDGYAVGGSTRRLKFETPVAAMSGSAIFNIVGGCNKITIKNCTLNNQSSGSSPMGIYINQFKGAALIDASPQNVLVSNNIINTVNQTVSGYGVRCNRSGSATTKITGLQVIDNTITVSGTGIEVYYCNGVMVSGNEIKVQKGTTTGSGIGVWLRGSAGDMYVKGNKFTQLVSVQTGTGTYATQGILTGATSSIPFNVNIFNNTFSGINRSVTGPAALNQSYIADIGYGTTKIYHNTFYLPTLTLPTLAGAYNAISYTTTNYKADIQNNIFISDEDAKSVLISKAVTTGTMNNNIYFLRKTTGSAKIIDTYSDLASFKLNNATLETGSKSVDVTFADAAAGNLLISGTSVQDGNLKVPVLADVKTDITGKTRDASFTYAGAHESTLPFIITGIAKVSEKSPLKVTASGIEITANGAAVEIITPNGLTISRSVVSGTFSRSLSAGIYIVRINEKAYKIIQK